MFVNFHKIIFQIRGRCNFEDLVSKDEDEAVSETFKNPKIFLFVLYLFLGPYF